MAVTGLGWTIDAGDYPREIVIGGEVMTVTAVGALSSGTQQFTVVRGVNGVTKGHDVGSSIQLSPSYVLGM